MGYEDRDYHRDGGGSGGGFAENPLRWLFTGQFPLFRVFGVQVNCHASLLVISVLVLLFGQPFGDSALDRVVFIGVLFGVILLHEFGHVFAARWGGGRAEEILMTPLGGLALAESGKGWKKHTITIIGGPAVNVIICLVCGLLLGLTAGFVPLGPYSFETFRVLEEGQARPDWFAPAVTNVAFYAYYVYSVSYFLLLFNLLPIFPLDGGQLLQGVLWSKLGWYRATLYATAVGLVGAVLLGIWGLATFALLLIAIAAMCGITCYQLNRQLKAEGPWAFSEQDEPDYAASLRDEEPTWAERRAEKREAKRLEQQQRAEADEQAELDRVLARLSQVGMDNLTRGEKKTLEQATAKRQAKRR